MINGVLVERTVKDVKPALQTNSDGLKKVLEELVKQYKGLQDEMENWKVQQPPAQPEFTSIRLTSITEEEQRSSRPAVSLPI